MLARFGQYLLFERLNQGGMAEVYLAKSFGLHGADQTLVLKCIRPDRSTDPTFVTMFVEEAKVSALLSHQNIVRTYELGCVGNRHFIAMEHLPGRDLRAVLARLSTRGIAMPEELALYVVAQTCDGLDYAHRKTGHDGEPLNIVHRDVSPPNVLIGYDGQVKLIDFGVAKIAARSEHSRVLKGKYAYMSPEQARGRRVDERSDVFSTGALLFELLTGQRLFTGRSELSVLDKVRYCECYPPRLAQPSISAECQTIALTALRLNVNDRYQSAAEMRDAIVAFLLNRKSSASSRQLATLMEELFVDEMRDEQARLSELRAMEMPDTVPDLEEITVPSRAIAHSAEPDTTVSENRGAKKPEPASNPDQLSPRASYVVIIGLSVLVAVLVLLLVFSA